MLTTYDTSQKNKLFQIEEDGDDLIEEKFQKAVYAFSKWSQTPLNKRIEVLNAFQSTLDKNKDDLSLAISQEMGKPLWESKQEVQAAISKVSISIEAIKSRCPELTKDFSQGRVITRHKPHGVTLVIGPYNFPIHLPNGHIVPALLAGNSVLFKPSEKTPYTAFLYEGLWKEAGLPEGVLQIVYGRGKQAETLLKKEINGVYFTGSFPVGLQIRKNLIERPDIIIALEMGGVNPLMIGEISDLHAASYLTVLSSFLTSGQRCTCARKLIVQKGLKGDAFLKELVHMAKSIQVGFYDEKPEPFMGPLATQEAADHIYELSKKIKGHALLKMERKKGALLTPGIIEVEKEAFPDEEIFGPLLPVIRVECFEEGIYEANNTKFGLSAGLFSDRMEEYEQFYQAIKAGVINWNSPLTGASSHAPFGGVKMSGNHRPSAFYAADYTAYPVQSTESSSVHIPSQISPGIKGVKK